MANEGGLNSFRNYIFLQGRNFLGDKLWIVGTLGDQLWIVGTLGDQLWIVGTLFKVK